MPPARLTAEQKAAMLKLVEDAPRGSKLSIAKIHAFDLFELVENLSLTPTERLEKFSRRTGKMLDRARRKHLLKTQRKQRTVN